MKPINVAIKNTNGYKTKSAVLIYLLLQIFSKKIPISPANQEILVNITDVLMASGLFHDVWRHREAIIDWIKNFIHLKKIVS